MDNPNLDLGPIGLGTFPFSGVFREIGQDDAGAIVKEHITLGGRYIETAPSYPIREVDLGAILSKFNRDDFLIGTKCVTGINPDGTKVRSGHPDNIKAQCISEISRLGVDYLDVMQSHITPDDIEPAMTMDALNQLKSDGLVKYVGVSNVDLTQLKLFEAGGDVDIIQNRMSLLHEGHHRSLVDHCLERGIVFNQFQVIERGLLTGNTTGPGRRRADDLRESKPEYVGEAYEVVRQWFEQEITPLARELNVSVEELSVGWVLGQPCVNCCVIGSTRTAQTKANIESGRLLPGSIVEALNNKVSSFKEYLNSTYDLDIDTFRGLA